MNKIDETLRELDPAVTPADLDARADPSARAQADRIVASDPGAAADSTRRPGRITARRVLATGSVAAAAVFGALALLDGDDRPGGNIAWAATPDAVGKADADAAAVACRREAEQTQARTGKKGDFKTVAVERRGSHVLAAVTDGGSDALCLFPADATTTPARAASFSMSFGGDNAPPPPSPRGVELTSVGGPLSIEDESAVVVTGRVGPAVEELILKTGSKGPVTATVNQGRFVAWWPGKPVGPEDRQPARWSTGGGALSESEEEADVTTDELGARKAVEAMLPAEIAIISGATVVLEDGERRELSADQLAGATSP